MTIPPAAVIALRELITKWRSSPNAISPRQIDQCADALDALLARVEPQELPELPSWMPSTSELLQHMTLYRALRAAVDALDPAAADNRLYIEWDAAKWAVFNAAVRLVKETAPDIGIGTAARVEPQDCGLSANDIYHVMLAWEQQPASDEQTRIVTGLGKLREQFIQRGDSPYVTEALDARVEPEPALHGPAMSKAPARVEPPPPEQERDYLRGYAAALIDAMAAIEYARDTGGDGDMAFDGLNAALFVLRRMRPPSLAARPSPPTQEPT